MTDHTAIIERMARAMFHEDGSSGDYALYLHNAEVALSASGLLEVLEKGDQLQGSVVVAHGFIHKGQPDKADREFMADNLLQEARALRNAIKGVRG